MYKVYQPQGHVEKEFTTFHELMEWLHSKYDGKVPAHYLTKVKDKSGLLLSWGSIEVKNGDDGMTDYTSL